MGLWAALVVGVDVPDGRREETGEEPRVGDRAERYRSDATRADEAGATDGTPLSFPGVGPAHEVGPA